MRFYLLLLLHHFTLFPRQRKEEEREESPGYLGNAIGYGNFDQQKTYISQKDEGESNGGQRIGEVMNRGAPGFGEQIEGAGWYSVKL